MIKTILSPELVVDFLVEHKNHPVHVIHTDEVRAPEIVLDEADNSTGSLVPSVVMRRTLTSIDLSHGCSQSLAS